MPSSFPPMNFTLGLSLYQSQLEQVERDLLQPTLSEPDRRILTLMRAVLQRKVRWYQTRGTLGLCPPGVFTTLNKEAARKARNAIKRDAARKARDEGPESS